MTIQTTLRLLTPTPTARRDPSPRKVPDHAGHPMALYPGGLQCCLSCQRAEQCVCGDWIVGDDADGGMAAVQTHQRTPVHVAYHAARHEFACCRAGD